MLRALKIAFGRMGNTSPNPPVGAVIVKDGVVVATGGTMPCGKNHAEVVAIEAAGSSCTGAEMYVTLEPCCHHGKTPPCTEAIIGSGIERVYIAILDPNPLVAGKGAEALVKAGVDVVFMHDLQSFAADIYRPFKKSILRKKPFVINKSAMTMDGRIATGSGDSKWITSAYSRYLVHKLRAKVDAIVIGKNTFLRDRPLLTVRLESYEEKVAEYFRRGTTPVLGRNNFFLNSLLGEEIEEYKNPCKIILGLPDEISHDNGFFSSGEHIIFEHRDVLDRMFSSAGGRGELNGLTVVPLDGKKGKESIPQIMEEFQARGFMTVLLEGGATISGSFFDAGEIDQFMYFHSPRIAGNGIPPLMSVGVHNIKETLPLHDVSYVVLRDEFIFNGYKETYNFEML